MKKYVPVILLAILFGCGDKKKTGNDPVVSSDFFKAFSKLKLPFSASDSSLDDIKADTASINYNVFNQFVPDTVVTKTFSKEAGLTINPIGKYEEKGKETYMLVRIKSKKKSAVYLLVFDKKQKFSASMPLVKSNENKDTSYSSAIDNRLAISINKQWKRDDEFIYNRTIYSYNNAGLFSVVMTETNDQSNVANKMLNPIDTLPKKNKYSGDYTKGKKSLLSIRDGKTVNSYLFFVHFENDNEDEPCNGDLRGGFILKTPVSAIFSENNDPCVIDFTFKSNSVQVKEQGSCGSHRGIKCFFNDTYTKKKELKVTNNK